MASLFDVDQMVWVFQCIANPALFASTLSESGRNLPEMGGWNQEGWLIVGPGNRPWIDEIENGIESDGYYLHHKDDDPLASPTIQQATFDIIAKIG